LQKEKGDAQRAGFGLQCKTSVCLQ